MSTSAIDMGFCSPHRLCIAALLLGSWGCHLIPHHISHLTPPAMIKYYMRSEAVVPEGEVYYVDPTDSSTVWSREGVQVKVRPLNDDILNAEYGIDATNPYTLGEWKNSGGFTPPLHTVLQVTIINRTRERVEMDLTRVILRLDNGYRSYAAGGNWDGPHGRTDYERKRYRLKETGDPTGPWDHGYPHSYTYVYPLRGDHDGRSSEWSRDRSLIATRSGLLREKPVRKGQKYDGKITFPPLPADVESFTLELNDFILAFDSNKVGYGNPVEFTDMAFHFTVDHGVMVVDQP